MMKFFKKLFSLPFTVVSKNAKKTKLRPEDNRKRIGKTVFFLALCVFTIFIFRLVWLITVNHVAGVNLREYASYNYKNTIVTQAKRGTIYDRYGTPIAVDASTYTIYVVIDKKQYDANHNKMFADKSDFPKIEDFLHSQLGIDKDYADKQLNLKGYSQVQFGAKGKDISLQKRQAMQKVIDEEKLVGIGFNQNLSRIYPMSTGTGGFASQFIGTALPNDLGTQLRGLDGLESSFNSILNGQNGKETYQKDNLGRPLPGTTKVIKKVQNGSDLYTTLDSRLQEQLETSLTKAYNDSAAEQVSATLMTNTGQILATSQRPTYSAQTRQKVFNEKNPNFFQGSLLFQSAFEPGSTMKTFLMASAVNSGKVNLNATYDRSQLKVADATIKDWDVNEAQDGQPQKPTILTFADGFMMSSNVGMGTIERNMGFSTWDQYLKRFKFNNFTRTGFGFETIGGMPTTNEVQQATSAFGQGISVTQIQLLRGWTAFGNQGTMLEPQFVSQLVNPNNKTVLKKSDEVVGKPVSGSTIKTVLGLMEGVDTNPDWGTAYTYLGDAEGNVPKNSPLILVNGKPAAVKTGTAQVPSPSGGYIQGLEKNLYSLVAMYPPQNPKFIFYMNIKLPGNPWSLHYISRVANPLLSLAVARESEIFQSANPTTVTKPGKVTVKDYKGQYAGPTADSLRRETLQPVIVGAGSKVVSQSVAKDTKVGANRRILLLTDGGPTMPDTYDWAKADVEQLKKWYDLKITYSGSGDKVTGQSVSAGSTIKKGQSMTITLGN